MTCDEVRAGLSARLDSEDAGIPPGLLDEHLAGCPACAGWLARAEQVTRAVRVQSVAVPDLTAPILAAVAADPRIRAAAEHSAAAAHGRRQILRVAVGAAALVQLLLAVQVLVGSLSGLGLPAGNLHTSREMASFDLALAVGFALVALRPARARAFVPVAFVLAACLAVTSGLDVANATTVLAHEVGHLFVVVQAGLLWALGRSTPGPAEPRPAVATA
jgi:predicted anti-sigma-YlaC factor YlaD